ncbi:hypothetical protein [uncultured Pseudonocardia sp.]|jgi:hypothetical protein|uniref:hypothetical protein n=1 Tax=uncultured Pseudonocardia sp. TaxID=211455 RepID=UPI002625D996|nr:hypothetical protein [uncultured Pseudonocardia sp.]
MGSRTRAAGFIRPQLASTLYRADGTVTRTRRLAVWTLAHRGYSGSGRLDVWVYRTQRAALFAGADLAMEAGLDEDPEARAMFAAGRYTAVLARYEHTHPEGFLLRVQAAFLQDDELPDNEPLDDELQGDEP